MSETHEGGVLRSVTDVLATASAGTPRPRSDAAASRARLLARIAGPAPYADDAAVPYADESLAEAEAAGRELAALCADVVLARDAAARLAVFAEHAAADPEGALVFGCVLHLAGDGEGAAFWWQLAAGAEVERAARCMFLDHARRGEYGDAALWFRRLDGAVPRSSATEAVLTPDARRVIEEAPRWVRHHEHEDLGPVPTAGPGLAKAVFGISPQPVVPRPGAWMVPHPPAVTRPAARARPAESPGATGSGSSSGRPAPTPPGQSTGYSPAPLRHTTLTALARQTAAAPHTPDRWAAALHVLDVLHAVRTAGRPLSTAEIAVAAHLDRVRLGPLLGWLCRHLLLARRTDGAFTVGPLFSPAPTGDRVLRHDALTRLLGDLRDTTGAAIYVSRYRHGEVEIQHCADGPATPAVKPWVDFRLAAHASAVGKSLMAQLDFTGRMDHLARHRPVPLTERTITDPAALFRALDGHGPQASQFDLLEYSYDEVCAAVPLTLDGLPACVALSLPARHFPRLIHAADVLSSRSGLLLLTLLAELPAAAVPEGPDASETAPADPAGPLRTGAR
ncbi:IclR family transcriptional regulator C-terminal domain-containing protein [Streptomyces sp. NPDC053493]|uniref:IclR family transcriptional regulator domain-containing protein n=1 Tax=Streptomyces sp. NPDC053493 TaxID=3365705 RepID=UPI0037D90D23